MKQHINRHIHTLSEQVRWAAFEYRFRRSKLNQWIIRKCMPEIHRNHADLLASNGDWQSHCHRSQQTIDNLLDERALLIDSVKNRNFWIGQCDRADRRVGELQVERTELTEILMSLIARDDDGNWTTVFDADTLLPDDYQGTLHTLVDRA